MDAITLFHKSSVFFLFAFLAFKPPAPGPVMVRLTGAPKELVSGTSDPFWKHEDGQQRFGQTLAFTEAGFPSFCEQASALSPSPKRQEPLCSHPSPCRHC